MNRNQKIVLVIGIILLIILVATTPRYYEYPSDGAVVRRYTEEAKQLDLGEAFLRVAVVVLVTGGLILLLRSRKNDPFAKSAESPSELEELIRNVQKKCPSCAESIKLEALKCKHCGEVFDPSDIEKQVKERKAKIEEPDQYKHC